MKSLIDRFAELAFNRGGWVHWPPGPMHQQIFDQKKFKVDAETFALEVLQYRTWRPRVHGNGFIQLDLTPNQRMHFWGHPDIPKQRIATPIHDHRFAFTSRIIAGSLTNVTFMSELQSNGPYEVYRPQVRFEEDTILRSTGQRLALHEMARRTYYTGERYTMQPWQIHQSVADELGVTFMEKVETTEESRGLTGGMPQPRIFVPVGSVPDNDFNRYQLPEEDLWRIIAETMRGAR